MTIFQCINRLAQALVFSAMVAACGGGGDAAPPAPAPAGTIGPAGGTVTSPEGASVTIPAGALSSNVAVAVTKSSIALALPGGVQAAGDFFDLTPHSTTFAMPVTVAVPFDPAQVPAGAAAVLLKPDAAQTGWMPVPGATVSGSTISGQISSFADPVAAFVFPPTISQQPSDQTVGVQQSATFSVVATGQSAATPLTYAWQSSIDHGATWATIPGATNASYSTPAAAAGDNGTLYRVHVHLQVFQAVPQLGVNSASAMLTVTTSATTTPMIAAGVHHTLALKANGTVYAWGRNDQGQLGDGGNTMRLAPVQAVGLPSITKVSVGHYHSLALAADGSVWEWGNKLNVPGVPTQVAMSGRFTDIADGDFFSIALRDDGTVWSWSGASAAPAQVSGATGVVAIAAGTNQALALKNDATALAWTFGGSAAAVPGPTGTGVLANVQWVRAVAGASIALAANGNQPTVYVWGNGLSQFGFPAVNPVAAPALQPYASVPPDSYAIALGRGTTLGAFLLAIDGANGNTVKGVGANLDGELGIGSTVDATTATTLPGLLDVRQVDATHTFQATYAVARKGDGTVWAWGDNATGQLGDGTTFNRLVPVPVQGLNLN